MSSYEKTVENTVNIWAIHSLPSQFLLPRFTISTSVKSHISQMNLFPIYLWGLYRWKLPNGARKRFKVFFFKVFHPSVHQ